MSVLAGILDAWPVLLGMLIAVAGAIVSTRGNRRADEGATLARAAAIESQLTRPPAEVIAEARRGLERARSGRHQALVGLLLSCLGCGLAVGSLVVQLAS